VRLVHVASPQPEAGTKPDALRALLNGRELWLAFERPGQPTLDRDGVLLVYLYDGAGQNLNIALVSLGWASYAATDGDDPLASRFHAAQREAHSEQRAMWTVWTLVTTSRATAGSPPAGTAPRDR
jgi:endonuclease YncB( thermonuclease family)